MWYFIIVNVYQLWRSMIITSKRVLRDFFDLKEFTVIQMSEPDFKKRRFIDFIYLFFFHAILLSFIHVFSQAKKKYQILFRA